MTRKKLVGVMETGPICSCGRGRLAPVTDLDYEVLVGDDGLVQHYVCGCGRTSLIQYDYVGGLEILDLNRDDIISSGKDYGHDNRN